MAMPNSDFQLPALLLIKAYDARFRYFFLSHLLKVT